MKCLNTLRPRQNGRHLPDNIFKCISFNENVWISIEISLKFVRKGSINNIPALVQIMAWRRPGDKPLSEPMMVRLPTHICVTRPQRVNQFFLYMHVSFCNIPYICNMNVICDREAVHQWFQRLKIEYQWSNLVRPPPLGLTVYGTFYGWMIDYCNLRTCVSKYMVVTLDSFTC